MGSPTPTAPKIELHVHLEGTVRAPALLEMARRNGVRIPAASEQELAELYAYRDFAHWCAGVLRTARVRRHGDDRRRQRGAGARRPIPMDG